MTLRDSGRPPEVGGLVQSHTHAGVLQCLVVRVDSGPTLDVAYERWVVDAVAELVTQLQHVLADRSRASRTVVIVGWDLSENAHLCEAVVGAVRGLVLSIADEVAPSAEAVPPTVLNVIVAASVPEAELLPALDYLASPEAAYVSAATLRLETR